MPRKVRVRKWRPGPRRALTFYEKLELAIGPGRDPQFADDEARRKAWEEHREVILAFVNKTTRPWAWWQFECEEAQDYTQGDAQLERLGVLTDEEKVRVAKWRARREQDSEGGDSCPAA